MDGTGECECDATLHAAKEPKIPIVFDELTTEFHLLHTDGKGHMIIRHCMWCGGRLPESKREELFAHVTHAETMRLQDLARDFATLDEVVERFGPPDADTARGMTVHSRATEAEPERIESYRSLTYHGLSETADVIFTDYREKGVYASFHGKYIGEKKRGEGPSPPAVERPHSATQGRCPRGGVLPIARRS